MDPCDTFDTARCSPPSRNRWSRATALLSVAALVLLVARPAFGAPFWQPLHEPGTNGWGTALEVSPFDSNTLAAGGDMFGAATTNDQGASWNPALGFQMWEIADYTWHPTSSNILWVGTRGGPYQSLDNGKTWKSMRSGMPPASTSAYTVEIQKVIFDPNDANTLLALGGSMRSLSNGDSSGPGWGQIWKSTNGGASWSQAGNVGTDVNIVTGGFAAGSSSIVYVVSPSGVFESTNGGTSWSNVTSGISGTPAFLALHPKDPGTLWVSTQSSEIYKSTDGGSSWQSSSTGLEPSSLFDDNSFVVVNASNPDVLYAAMPSGSWERVVYLSTNGGASWTDVFDDSSISEIDAKLPGGDAYYSAFARNYFDPLWLATDPNDAKAVYIFISGYIGRSLDSGNTWTDISAHEISGTAYRGNGYQGEASSNVKWNPFNPGQLFAVSLDCGKLVRSNDYGFSWIAGAPAPVQLWDGSEDTAFSSDGTIYVASGQYDTSAYEPVLKSTDWGATWAYVASPPNVPQVANWAVYTLPSDSSTVWVGAGSVVFQSQNGGQSWTAVTESLGYQVYNFAPDPTAPTTFYVGAANGIYKTTDGVHFNLIPGSPTSTVGNQVVVDPQSPSTLYAVPTNPPDGGVWKYDGTAWTQIWSKRYANALAIDPHNDQRLAVVTTGWPSVDISEADGVWLSENAGQTWTQINTGLQLLRGSTIAFNPDESAQLIVGLGGGGFFVTDLGVSTPYGGTPASAPGTVEARDYDVGGEGVAYHDPEGASHATHYRSDDIGICAAVSATALCGLTANEWIKYQVNVEAGTYDVTIRAAGAAAGATLHLEVNGLNVTGPVTVPNMGASVYTAIAVPGLSLAAGTQYLKVHIDASGVNLESIQIGAGASHDGGAPPGKPEARDGGPSIAGTTGSMPPPSNGAAPPSSGCGCRIASDPRALEAPALTLVCLAGASAARRRLRRGPSSGTTRGAP
jgi:photosystem II stability/assembly factor-like uncharacterized protein